METPGHLILFLFSEKSKDCAFVGSKHVPYNKTTVCHLVILAIQNFRPTPKLPNWGVGHAGDSCVIATFCTPSFF